MEAILKDSARNDDVNREMGAMLIPTEKIHQSDYNPRVHFDSEYIKELAESIKSQGLLQPILVRPHAPGYEIVAGECRYRACKLAGLTVIPAIVKELTDQEARRCAIIENMKRRDINPIEQARGFAELLRISKELDPAVTQEAVAKDLGIKSQATFSNCIRLLDLPEEVQKQISSGKLTASHGKALLQYAQYPKVMEQLTSMALNGTPTKVIESFDISIINSGDLDKMGVQTLEQWNAKFSPEKEGCIGCEHKRKRYCLNAECFKAKKQAFIDAAAEEAKRMIEECPGGSIDLDSIAGSAWTWLSKDVECEPDCKYSKTGLRRGSAFKVCCNPACHSERVEKIIAEKKNRNKATADAYIDEAHRLMTAEQVNEEIMAKLTSIMIAKLFIYKQPKSIKEAADFYGIDLDKQMLNLLVKSGSNQEFVEKLEWLKTVKPATLIYWAADVFFREEANNITEGYGKGELLKWFINEPEHGPLYQKMMAEIQADSEVSE